MINTHIIEGYSTRDVELKKTRKGTNFVRAFIGVRSKRKDVNGEYVTDFHKVILFGKRAENYAKYVGKGSLISIRGESQINIFEVNGNKVKDQFILANEVNYLKTNRPGYEIQDNEVNKIINDDIATINDAGIIDDDMLPFDFS